MARVLELWDLSGKDDERTGDSVTLADNGRLVYTGSGIQPLFAKFLTNHSPADVFNRMDGWSNGYAALRERT